jgi:hypothetical protein
VTEDPKPQTAAEYTLFQAAARLRARAAKHHQFALEELVEAHRLHEVLCAKLLAEIADDLEGSVTADVTATRSCVNSRGGVMVVEQVAHERIYPCRKCGVLRTKAEGGTVFTVCDGCWDELHPPREATAARLLSATREQLIEEVLRLRGELAAQQRFVEELRSVSWQTEEKP